GSRAQLQASYTYQEPVSRDPSDIATGTPNHLVAGAVGVRVGPVVITPSATWRSSISYDLPPALTFTRPRLIAAGPGFDVFSSESTATVPSRLSVDATVAWPIRPQIEVALVGRNLLGEDAPDFPRFVAGDVLGNRFAESPPRLIFGRLRLSY